MSLIQDLEREQIRAIRVDPEGDKVMRMSARPEHSIGRPAARCKCGLSRARAIRGKPQGG
jgi:hypothetical protein